MNRFYPSKFNREQALPLAQELAKQLSGTITHKANWCAEKDVDRSALLRRDDGLTLQIEAARKEGYASIRPIIPHELRDLVQLSKQHSMTFDPTREPSVIAHEIERRIVPLFEQVLATGRATLARRRQRVTATQDTVSRLTQCTQGKLSLPNWQQSGSTVSEHQSLCGYVDAYYIRAEVNVDKVTLTIDDLSAEQAERILAQL